MNCLYCNEPLLPEHQWDSMIALDGPHRVHRECAARSVLGSVGHQQGRCHCFGGTEEDPPGMTKRQAAIAAYWFMLGLEIMKARSQETAHAS